jgi:secondary thiamine-phosphate synthase enzyme
MIFQKELKFATDGHGDMHDLTEEVGLIVRESRVRSGVVNVFAVGSTAGICSIEFEPGLEKDLPTVLSKLIPPSRDYGHEQTWHDGNGHSHLQASLIGPEITIPIRDSRLFLGTWQQVVHVEFDVRKRNREVIVTINGE